MRLSFSWLKEFIELSLHPDVLADRLTQSGCEVTALKPVDGDWIFEMEVTPNRPDLLSHLGIARETAAVLGRPFRFPRWLKREFVPPLPSPSTGSGRTGSEGPALPISVENSEDCHRYVGMVIEDVEVRASPPELAERLRRLGIRPINNVVDVTNLCLLELGQPLHAFDLDKLEGPAGPASGPSGPAIRVRRADSKERLTTIDGVKRELNPGMLVIADARRPVALAGIMGGQGTEISSATRRVLLESAWFSPPLIRRTSRALKVSSESSYRFERGIDPALVPLAAIRAARWISTLAGGTVRGGLIEVGQARIPQRSISLRPQKARELIGIPITLAQQRRIVERLGCRVKGTGRGLRVEPPSWRADLKIPEDLYEELARLKGYDRCPATLPPVTRQAVHAGWASPEDPWIMREGEIREWLVAAGGQEIVTYSLVSPKAHAQLGLSSGKTVKLWNPLSLEYSELRRTLAIGALETLARNLHRKSDEVFHLFELGRIYEWPQTSEGLSPKGRTVPHERRTLSLLMAGTPTAVWGTAPEPFGIFHIKGVVQSLCERLRLSGLQEKVESGPPYLSDPAIAFHLGKRILGRAGTVAEKVLSAFEIPAGILVAWAELNLEVIAASSTRPLTVQPLPKVSPVVRDLAIVLSEEIPYAEVRGVIEEVGRPLLQGVALFDLYRGAQIPPAKKSLAFRLTYSAGDRTLTTEEINACHQRIVAALAARFNATLR